MRKTVSALHVHYSPNDETKAQSDKKQT